MSKMIIAFLILFCLIFAGIEVFQTLTKSEKINLTKWVVYSIVCAVMTMVVIAGIVFIF